MSGDTDTSVSFNNGRSTIGYATWQDLTTAFSVEAIVKTTATGTRDIILRDSGVSGRVFQLRQNGANLEFVKISGSIVTASQACSLNDGNWHHVVATYDGSDIRLYNNGTLLGSPTAAPGSLTGNSPIVIANGINAGWIGQIDEVAYYNTVLSGTRIAAHYAAL